MSNWNLPPGVSPSDPHLTGIWPCADCYGEGADWDEDGPNSCPRCGGLGDEPEELPADYVLDKIMDGQLSADDFTFWQETDGRIILSCCNCRHAWIPGKMERYGDHACPKCDSTDTGRVSAEVL